MATVDKNFRIKNGLVVEGSTATVGGEDVLTKKQADQNYIINLIGGTATSSNTANAVVKRDSNGDFAAGTITADLVGNVTGTVSSLSNHDTGDLTEGSNLYFTNQRALDATAQAYDTAGSAANAYSDAVADANAYTENAITNLNLSQTYDAYGAASAAESAANTYTTNAINALTTDDIEEGSSNKYFTNGRAQDAVGLNVGTGLTYDPTNGSISVDNTIANKSYVDTAISNLVDGAPALLNTLNEIAAAIGDDANYFTTIANQIASKQNNLTAGSNIDITNDVISVTGLTTNEVSEGQNQYFTTQRAQDAINGTTPNLVGINYGWVAKEFAEYTWIGNGSQSVVATWPLNYATAKLLVHMRNGSHSQASEIMVARDSSNNLAISEYGIVTTNGSLGDITAAVDGSNIVLKITPTYNNGTDVAVKGSAVLWAD